MSAPKIAFEMQRLTLALEKILPVRQLNDPGKKFTRYKTILSSVKEAA